MAGIVRARERAQMAVTPPEASHEYSRAQRGSGEAQTGESIVRGIVGLALLGALLLVIADFTTLYRIGSNSAGAGPAHSYSGGGHHGFAMALIGLTAAALAFGGVWRERSRPALLAVGVLGLAALLIALLGDLPDAHATGLLHGANEDVVANSRPSIGFYLETLGALLVLVGCVGGFVLAGPPGPGAATAGSEKSQP